LCLDYGNFSSQYLQWRGRERRKYASTIDVHEVADRFQREI
jgi:hypothetical protein